MAVSARVNISRIWEIRSKVFDLYERYHLSLVADPNHTAHAVNDITSMLKSIKTMIRDLAVPGHDKCRQGILLTISDLSSVIPRFKDNQQRITKLWNRLTRSLADWAAHEEQLAKDKFTSC